MIVVKDMVDKNKYLYWLTEKTKEECFNENLDEIIYREMYARIGYMFHLFQMNEYNIANILALEEFEKQKKESFSNSEIQSLKQKIDNKFKSLSKLTFGKLKSRVEKSKYLKDIDMKLLKEVIDYRNYLAHECFKQKLLNDELKSLEDTDTFIDEINQYENKAKALNEYLICVFEKNRIKKIIVKDQLQNCSNK